MILIYSEQDSPRLQYICRFIFEEQLGLEWAIVIDYNEFVSAEGPIINYSRKNIPASFQIANTDLLFQTDVRAQNLTCSNNEDYKIIFEVGDADRSFDFFAAIFYLITRYEEYLPHEKDMYGRYAHENSIAWKEGFLEKPIVNYWIQDLSKSLSKFFPSLKIRVKQFKFLPTYDIDIAWSYKNKGLLRNLGGFAKSPSIDRLSVLTDQKPDPFDAYEFLDRLHSNYNLSPIYFFLVAEKRSRYDKNISPDSVALKDLIEQHSNKYETGLHPSWQSNDTDKKLYDEKHYLENVTGREIKKSRQHYIRFSLPDTFIKLINAGITDDYSMGYGSINGYRASVASPFLWYDLKQNKETNLRLHPFCYMDANSHYEQRLTPVQAYAELITYYRECKKINGTLITIFHNNFLGPGNKEWQRLYNDFFKVVNGI